MSRKEIWGRAINNDGLVAGRNESIQATLFHGATETVLTAGTAIAGDSTEAIDINDAGQVIIHNLNTQRAFRYDIDSSTLLAIPSLAPAVGGHRTFAKGINGLGDVVGWGDRNGGLSGQGRGFLYDDSDEATYILEDHTILRGSDREGLSDWSEVGTAWGINDKGWIVGRGDRRFDGATFPTARAFLLTPFDGLAGDYNDDGSVDVLDYVTWRDNFGAAAGTCRTTSMGGEIRTAQFDTWKEKFEAASMSASLSLTANPPAIPEPTSGMLILWAAVGTLLHRVPRR